MIYKIIRQDKESDDITLQSFNCYDEAYDLLEEIYSDVCCSDADYGDPIMKLLKWKNETYRESKSANYLVSKQAGFQSL